MVALPLKRHLRGGGGIKLLWNQDTKIFLSPPSFTFTIQYLCIVLGVVPQNNALRRWASEGPFACPFIGIVDHFVDRENCLMTSQKGRRVGDTLFFFLLALCFQTAKAEVLSSRCYAGHVNKETLLRTPHEIVNASEGGWPVAHDEALKAPFEEDDDVVCYTVDSVQGYLDLRYCKVQSTTDHIISLICGFDGVVTEIAEECCERYSMDDTTVFKSPGNGLHYSIIWETLGVMRGFYELERQYPNISFDDDTIFAYYGFDGWSDETDDEDEDEEHYWIDTNFPKRVEKSTNKYKRRWYSLTHEISYLIDDKLKLARRAHEAGLVGLGPFPKTYLSCEAALESVSDPDALFYVKLPDAAWGVGVEVITREELEWNLEETDECEEDLIFQEAITDLALISEQRFDIRFYILVHGESVYLHENSHANFHASDDETFDGTSADQANAFVKKFHSTGHVSAFLDKDHQTGGWMNALYKALGEALPVFEGLFNVTAKDHDRYHIFGGDAMIRENGEAIVVEFNDWPSMSAVGGVHLTTLDITGVEVGERTYKGGREKSLSEKGIVLCDFFAIVMGLVDTNSATILDGRVRKVKPQTCSGSSSADE